MKNLLQCLTYTDNFCLQIKQMNSGWKSVDLESIFTFHNLKHAHSNIYIETNPSVYVILDSVGICQS